MKRNTFKRGFKPHYEGHWERYSNRFMLVYIFIRIHKYSCFPNKHFSSHKDACTINSVLHVKRSIKVFDTATDSYYYMYKKHRRKRL